MPRKRRPPDEIWEQRQSAAAAELLSLLETVTADGVLTDEEIKAIRSWLDTRGSGRVPNAEYLRMILEHVLADGKISEAERREVYRAVERVLPPELRQRARSLRLAREAVEKIRRQEEKRKNSPILRLDIPVVGIAYSGRAKVVERYARTSEAVYLVREPDNPADSNAVMVLLRRGYQIGYVPREEAETLAPLLDAGCKQKAWIKKIIQGEVYPVPYIIAEIYDAEADLPGLASQEDLPEKKAAPLAAASGHEASSCSCLMIVGVAALLFFFFVLGMMRGC